MAIALKSIVSDYNKRTWCDDDNNDEDDDEEETD